MTKSPIRIMLVDQHKVARESWRMLLNFDERFEVIHETDNPKDAIDYALDARPDIVLIDINLQPVNGFELAKTLLEKNAALKIIGISVTNHPSYSDKMIQLGAKGYITKGSSFEEITRAIEMVYDGRNYICEEIRNAGGLVD